MKIPPPSLDPLRNGKEPGAPASERTKAAPASGTSGADRVDLSALSAQIAALETTLADAPFDRARVASIKQAIVEGRLAVGNDVVAERMIASALALIQRPQ